MKYVLDASAVLALLNREPGAERVAECLADAAMSAVNFVEVGTRLVDVGMSPETAMEALRLLDLAVVAFDAGHAEIAINLRGQTRSSGLSLADRACLALAVAEGATALTSDRAWKPLDAGCGVELIR